jgi:hypothetical protein
VATRPPTPPAADRQIRSPLTDCLVAMAGTPDDSSWIDTQLTAIVQLVADLVEPVDHASITVHRNGAYTTIAASSDLALAVDEVQYADEHGPCLDALDGGKPTAVADLRSAMAWPALRDAAHGLGLRASLSVPLFAGHGSPVAALNLHSRDPGALSPLSAAVWSTFDPGRPPGDVSSLDDGSAALVSGLIGAFAVRDVIQQAIGIILAEQHRSTDAAYLALRLRAAETGQTLIDTATAVIAEHLW